MRKEMLYIYLDDIQDMPLIVLDADKWEPNPNHFNVLVRAAVTP